MGTPRIIPASALTPGLATIIVSLPGRTIRSCALMVQAQPHGVVQVAFASGEIITLMARTMVASRHRRPALVRADRPPLERALIGRTDAPAMHTLGGPWIATPSKNSPRPHDIPA